MHPELSMSLARSRREEMIGRAREARRAAAGRAFRPGVPRWRITWSRATLAAAGASGRPSRSWVIIISATRGA